MAVRFPEDSVGPGGRNDTSHARLKLMAPAPVNSNDATQTMNRATTATLVSVQAARLSSAASQHNRNAESANSARNPALLTQLPDGRSNIVSDLRLEPWRRGGSRQRFPPALPPPGPGSNRTAVIRRQTDSPCGVDFGTSGNFEARQAIRQY